MNKKNIIILLILSGILLFVLAKDQRVFADRNDYYVCTISGNCNEGSPGYYGHYWCDDEGWCSICDYYGCQQTTWSCGSCSVSCGGGQQYCQNVDAHCGGGCGGGGWYSCNTQACCSGIPINCGGWSACSTSCGTGTQTRTCYDSVCGTPIVQSQACSVGVVNGGWSAWSTCVGCVTSTQNRTCTNPAPACGGAACSGPSTQTCTPAVNQCNLYFEKLLLEFLRIN